MCSCPYNTDTNATVKQRSSRTGLLSLHSNVKPPSQPRQHDHLRLNAQFIRQGQILTQEHGFLARGRGDLDGKT